MTTLELKKLEEWLQNAASFELPSYKELPSIPLYMEQVVGYVNKAFSPLSASDFDQPLTSFMVNNYVKAGILKEPTKKKYTEEHLGYLIAIMALKKSLSMSEISLLVEVDKNLTQSNSERYGFIRSLLQGTFKDESEKMQDKAKDLTSRFEEEKTVDPEKASTDLRYSMILAALQLAIQSGVEQTIASMILREVAKDLHTAKEIELESKPSSHELRGEKRLSKVEAKRVALAHKTKNHS